jgi:hypothetical protein
MVNNIISGVDGAGMHVFIEKRNTAANSKLHHDLLQGTARIKWGSSTIYDLPRLLAAKGQGQFSLNFDPMFVNPSADQFGLQGGSPAIDAGSAESVYATFQSLYGLSIAADAVGTPRPQGAAFDIGGFEYTGIVDLIFGHGFESGSF